MSLASKIGMVLIAVVFLYFVPVPLIKGLSPGWVTYLPAFILMGLLGAFLFYYGMRLPETKSP